MPPSKNATKSDLTKFQNEFRDTLAKHGFMQQENKSQHVFYARNETERNRAREMHEIFESHGYGSYTPSIDYSSLVVNFPYARGDEDTTREELETYRGQLAELDNNLINPALYQTLHNANFYANPDTRQMTHYGIRDIETAEDLRGLLEVFDLNVEPGQRAQTTVLTRMPSVIDYSREDSADLAGALEDWRQEKLQQAQGR